MRKELNGIAASKGVVIAKAYKLEEISLDFTAKTDVVAGEELTKFETALNDSIAQLDEIKVIAATKLGEEEAEVFEAHKAILLDPELKSQVEAKINAGVDAATATKDVTDQFVTMFESMDNEYFAGRAADIKDVRKRLIANILEMKIPSLATINEQVIIVAEDLTPSETYIDSGPSDPTNETDAVFDYRDDETTEERRESYMPLLPTLRPESTPTYLPWIC